jgi:signal transduction histidine kinase
MSYTTRSVSSRPAQKSNADQLAKIADQAFVAIQEVEAISYDLRPYQLDRLGLTKAIFSLIQTFESSGSIMVTHSIANIDGFLPKDLEVNLYRIVQEAFGNILKHAGATDVRIDVTLDGKVLRLVIADNGRGFNAAPGSASRVGLGLIGIQERAEALGGQAVIQSGEHLGTQIIVSVAR